MERLNIIDNIRIRLKRFSLLPAVDCGTPPSPVNGEVVYQGTTLGNQATQSCNIGYTIDGPKVRVCQPNGQWSGVVAACIS